MISLCFTTSNGFLSRIIRRVTRSETSHVAFSTSLHGVPVLVHAALGGVQITPRARWLKQNRLVAEFDVKPDLSMGLAEAVRRVGDRYDYRGLLGHLAVLFAWRWLHRRIQNPFASPVQYVCSELVIRSAVSGKIPEWAHIDPERITPGMLLDLCRMGESFKVIYDNG